MNKIIFVTIILISFNSCMQFRTGREGISDSCDKFMRTFSNGKFGEAVQGLKKFSNIERASIDTLEKTAKNQMENIAGGYGKITSYSYIGERMVKDFLVKRIYILRFEKYCLKFSFTIYKGNTGWTVINFKYSEEIDDLF